MNFRNEFVQCYCWNYYFSKNCLKNILYVFTTLCINKKGSIKRHRPSENHQNMGSSMVFQQDHFVVAALIKSSIPTAILCTWYSSFYKTFTYEPGLISDWQSDTYIRWYFKKQKNVCKKKSNIFHINKKLLILEMN